MTTFEPGRIYSGVVDGKRQIIFRDGEHWHHVDGDGNLCGGDRYNGNYTDVRDPLVVLDPVAFDHHGSWQGIIDWLRERAWPNSPIARMADQIEEQVKPPLQVGWHEVVDPHNGNRDVMRWGGTGFYWPAGHAAVGAWTSTHFIGPGSGDPESGAS